MILDYNGGLVGEIRHLKEYMYQQVELAREDNEEWATTLKTWTDDLFEEIEDNGELFYITENVMGGFNYKIIEGVL
jgi:hypothetical protein